MENPGTAPSLLSYPRYRPELAPAPFLPMSRAEMDALGWDACDIIIRKIDMNDKFYLDERPASLYNIEYTPKLITRRTTGYARLDRNQSDEQKNK